MRIAGSFASFSRERALLDRGHGLVAGMDEVGRGPLAGPVVVCAVILDPDRIPAGLADSKTLPKAERERLFDLILANARHVSVASVSAAVIDRINIRQATLQAMSRACAALSVTPDIMLVDGHDPPPLACAVDTIIGGDSSIASIAAASIVAKVIRDRMMERLSERYPIYGFGAHCGYATPRHRAAIEAHGPCPEHRFSFAPIKGRWHRGDGYIDAASRLSDGRIGFAPAPAAAASG